MTKGKGNIAAAIVLSNTENIQNLENMIFGKSADGSFAVNL
jgi:hypothetical protein